MTQKHTLVIDVPSNDKKNDTSTDCSSCLYRRHSDLPSRRDLFAAVALHALLRNQADQPAPYDKVANEANLLADKMLIHTKKRGDPK